MALNLGDLDEYFDASIRFTVGGREYRIPPVSAELGLWARRIAARRVRLLDATDEELAAAQEQLEREDPPPLPDGATFEEALLSADLVADLARDGVSYEAVRHLAQVVYTRLLSGDEVALMVARGEDPNLPGPANREERRAAAKTARKTPAKRASGSRTTSTAAADTTPAAASGSGTSTPKPAKPRKVAASRGVKS